MFTVVSFILFWAWVTYRDVQGRSGLKWYEIKGVTKFLFLGETPSKRKCRACDMDLPDDTIFHVELSPGVYVHEECADPILLEAGLSYPNWFDQPMPADQEPKQIEPPKAYVCANCTKEHPEDWALRYIDINHVW